MQEVNEGTDNTKPWINCKDSLDGDDKLIRISDVPDDRTIESHENEEEEKGGEHVKEIDRIRDSAKQHTTSLLARLAKLNKPETPQLLLGSVAACAHGVVWPVFGLFISKTITVMFEPPHDNDDKLRKDAKFWSLAYVGLGIITMMVVPVQNYFFGVAGAKLIQRIRCLSFEKIVHQEISWFDDLKNSRCFLVFLLLFFFFFLLIC